MECQLAILISCWGLCTVTAPIPVGTCQDDHDEVIFPSRRIGTGTKVTLPLYSVVETMDGRKAHYSLRMIKYFVKNHLAVAVSTLAHTEPTS